MASYLSPILGVTGILVPFLFTVPIILSKSEKLSWTLALTASLYTLLALLYADFETRIILKTSFPFITYKGSITYSFIFDSLSRGMSTLTGIITFLVILFSHDYMRGDPGFKRYYASLLIFYSSMVGVALSANLITLLLFWVILGFSSFLLIGHWYQRYTARRAARIAIVTTGIGDVSMLLGISYLITHGLGYTIPATNIPSLPLTLILLGALTKSAQMPFHIWLLEAMEGPTTVSALLHSATMVAAGAYLVFRLQVSIISDHLLMPPLVIGYLTIFYSALLAIVERDAKKILAYSTIGNLGIMMVAVSASTPFPGFLHLFLHAFFKASLFLAIAAAIHSLHTTDIFGMGGLRKKLPFSYILAIFAALSQIGLPFYGSWLSHALIAKYSESGFLEYALFIDTLLSAIYIGRWLSLVYHGSPRWSGEEVEEGKFMKIVYLLLIVLIPLSPILYEWLVGIPLILWSDSAALSSLAGLIVFLLTVYLYSRKTSVFYIDGIVSILKPIEKGFYWLYMKGVPIFVLAIGKYLGLFDDSWVPIFTKTLPGIRASGMSVDKLSRKIVSQALFFGVVIVVLVALLFMLLGG
jgi:NADH:ubiquinone oxidoreductase subunit 5 (subunit L)/multisubunit Na+/H+ antiporter MnhA subunit